MYKKTSIKLFAITSSLILLSLLNISCTDNKITFGEWQLVASGQNFPEGIAWDNVGTLYSSNCNGNWITRINENQVDTFLIASDSTFGKTNGMLIHNNGILLACDFGIGGILKIDKNGKREILISGYKGVPLNRPNDITSDKYGNIYFTDPKSYGKDILDGRIFYYNFQLDSLFLVQSDLAFPNGIGISPANGKLYVCESAKSRILSFEITSANTLSQKQVFVKLPGGDPDGFNFDIDGNMYVAHFGGEAIVVISPNGTIINKIKTPGKKPSNVEFAGPDKKTLFITEDETNSIYKTNVSIPGFRF